MPAGKFEFSILPSTPTCTLYQAAACFHPSLHQQTGTSCLLKFPKPVTSTPSELGQGQLRFVSSHDIPATLWFKASASAWTVAELEEHGRDTHFVEVIKLGQGTEYELSCVYDLTDNGTRIFVLTPPLSVSTYFGDRDDFYTDSRLLGEGTSAKVYPGWHTVRAADGTRFEPRAVKVFVGSENDAFERWNREKDLLKAATAAADGSSCMIKWEDKVPRKMPLNVSRRRSVIRARESPACGRETRVTYLLPLELCSKGSLSKVGALNSELDLQDDHRCQIKELLALVQRFHEKTLMHKDLDLNNILVCQDGRYVDAHSAPTSGQVDGACVCLAAGSWPTLVSL
eukprot:7213231-Prymnesium_polylepis.1